jgi:methionyl-tRNA formyltransferase
VDVTEHIGEKYRSEEDRLGYRITVLVDDRRSWIVPWAAEFVKILKPHHWVELVHCATEIKTGDFCFLLGCVQKLNSDILTRNPLNLVVHESDLPHGRGFSPVAWQVLEGRSRIPVCLLEAAAVPDAGPVYLRNAIDLDGTELLPRIRQLQGQKTIELCLSFLDRWPQIKAEPQTGEATEYRRRKVSDDEIDPHRSIAEQFDHLRIVDNEQYPAWFKFRGKRFLIKVMPDVR